MKCLTHLQTATSNQRLRNSENIQKNRLKGFGQKPVFSFSLHVTELWSHSGEFDNLNFTLSDTHKCNHVRLSYGTKRVRYATVDTKTGVIQTVYVAYYFTLV
jgi:hypothetical protein